MEIISCCLLVFVYFCVVWHNLSLLWQKLSCLWQKLPDIYYISRMPGNVSVQNDNIGVWPGKEKCFLVVPFLKRGTKYHFTEFISIFQKPLSKTCWVPICWRIQRGFRRQQKCYFNPRKWWSDNHYSCITKLHIFSFGYVFLNPLLWSTFKVKHQKSERIYLSGMCFGVIVSKFCSRILLYRVGRIFPPVRNNQIPWNLCTLAHKIFEWNITMGVGYNGIKEIFNKIHRFSLS